MNSTYFLRYLQEVRREAFSFRPAAPLHPELRAILEEKREQIYITPDLLNELDFQHLDRIITSNIERLLEKLPTDLRAKLDNKVAIGGIELKNVNALIAKEPKSDVYAILINYGLVLYLLKFFSYIFAATDLDTIFWCDRMPKEELEPITIMKFTDELSASYLEYGIPTGPILLLDRSIVDTITYYCDLSIQFVICHELAHYFNGDCEQSANFTEWSLLNDTLTLEEEVSQTVEYQADVTGFSLLVHAHPDLKINSYGLYLFFIAMDWLYQRRMGQSHPDPMLRYRRIIADHYDEETRVEFERFVRAFTIGGDDGLMV